MNKKIKDRIFWLAIYFVVILVITFGWQGLELLFYGEIQHRIVDDIIGVILMWSILINIIFVKALYVNKSDRQKYVVLDKETYDNLHMKNYEEYYYTLTTLENNCKIADIIISDTIKNESDKEDETSTMKFDSIKSFAHYIKCFNDINMEFIKKKLQ